MPARRTSNSARSARASAHSAALASCRRTPPESTSRITASGTLVERRARTDAAANAPCFAPMLPPRNRASCATARTRVASTAKRAATTPSDSPAAMPQRARCGLAPAAGSASMLPASASAASRANGSSIEICDTRVGRRPQPDPPLCGIIDRTRITSPRARCMPRTYAPRNERHSRERQPVRAVRRPLPRWRGTTAAGHSQRSGHPLRRHRGRVGPDCARAGRRRLPQGRPCRGSDRQALAGAGALPRLPARRTGVPAAQHRISAQRARLLLRGRGAARDRVQSGSPRPGGNARARRDGPDAGWPRRRADGSRRTRSRKHLPRSNRRPTTWRRSCTRPARPAARRARCSPIATSPPTRWRWSRPGASPAATSCCTRCRSTTCTACSSRSTACCFPARTCCGCRNSTPGKSRACCRGQP